LSNAWLHAIDEETSMMHPLLIGPIGFPELLVILAIVFLIFGANKLPQLGAGLGEGIKNFKKSIKGGGGDDDTEETKSK
jgi:sec-independent protein translocase protein TatA